MAEPLQINRQYELKIGDASSGEGLLITNSLQVTFDVTKTSDNKNKTNSASIDIYNLSDESLKVLDTDYPAAYLSVGYRDIGSKQIFGGQVTSVSTRKSGTDRITSLTMGTAYTSLNHTLISKLSRPGISNTEILEEIRKELPGVDRGVYNCTESKAIYGYSLSGTPKEMLDEVCERYSLNWQIDDGVLYVHDNDRGNRENFEEAYVISKYTGLKENAYRITGDRRKSEKDRAKKQGIQMTILLNPDIQAGDIIKLEDTFISGFFKVNSTRHYGGFRDTTWYTDLRCDAIEKVVKS